MSSSRKCTKLTEKQKAFADRWVISLNGTKAVMESSPDVKSEKAAAVIACDYLANPKIQAYIRGQRAKLAKRVKISQDEVLLSLINLANVNIKEICKWGEVNGELQLSIKPSDELTPIQTDAIQEISETVSANGTRRIKVRLVDKIKAREMLGRHLGLFTDVVKVTALDDFVELLQKDPFENTDFDAEMTNGEADKQEKAESI